MATDDDLEETLEELERTLEELRSALQRERSTVPHPPDPGTLLDVVDKIAIPTAIAVLETNIRALEAFQRSIRLVRRERELRARTSATTESTRRQMRDAGRNALTMLDSSLEALQQLAASGRLPPEDHARELLEDARTLREDIDSQIDRSSRWDEPKKTEVVRIDITHEATDDNDVGQSNEDDTSNVDADSTVDVDAELETLRERYGRSDTQSSRSVESKSTSNDENDEGNDDSRGEGDESDGDPETVDDGSETVDDESESIDDNADEPDTDLGRIDDDPDEINDRGSGTNGGN